MIYVPGSSVKEHHNFDVSPADYVKLYGGMVRVLTAIEKASGPNVGLPTRKVSEDVFNSRTYGWKVLKQAEKLGYIKTNNVVIGQEIGMRRPIESLQNNLFN